MSQAVFQVFDGQGNEVMNLAASPGRVLGSTETNASNGSITVADLALGTPWFVCVPTGWGITPTVAINGTTISWTYQTGNFSAPVSCVIFYGIR